MFERFTENARAVVVHAQEEARQLGHPAIGTEHLLLGLLRVDEALAARVLGGLGLTLDAARDRLEQVAGSGGEPVAGQIPFAPDAKKVLELSLREALKLGHSYIGAEHMLLAIATESHGLAAQILHGLGADAETIRAETLALLSPGRGLRQPRHSHVEMTTRGPRFAAWTYSVERVARAELSAERLNALGRDGWELTAILEDGDELVLVLKRRTPWVVVES